MRRDLLSFVCCPACGGGLHAESPGPADGDEIVDGALACARCARRYPIRDRLPRLHLNDASWGPKAREADGWVRIHKKQGIYTQPPDAVDLKIPYYPEEPWITVARHFDAALEIMALTGAERILDLGAGRGWAAKHFAMRGCRAIAVEIAPDDQIGLGRAYALMESAGVRFDPVVGDSERLPFPDGIFDWVFGAAVLHHTADLAAVVRNAFRVLKPGGRLIAVNEPCISMNDDPRAVLARDAKEELAFGINESRPNYVDYFGALRRCGFEDIDVFPLDAYRMDESELEHWAIALGAIPGRGWVRSAAGTGRVLLDRARRWRAAWRVRGRLPLPRNRRESLTRAILLHSGGGVIVLARKRP